MTVTTTQPTTQTSSPRSRPSPANRAGRRLAVLVAGLAALTTGTVIAWSQLGENPARSSTNSVPSAAYQPGGSVYDEQVPAYIDWQIGYGPDSAMYAEQVPGHLDWSAGYGPGSPMYGQ